MDCRPGNGRDGQGQDEKQRQGARVGQEPLLGEASHTAQIDLWNGDRNLLLFHRKILL